ncbi:ABC transporter permease [Candidatus Halocynthiibacter alkanivorans]|uniref:ABC transporter permease n=1 Tax=Candidatus Halocynthiibacter alkanivorans TaxID=2267619 RepID=UPI000DF39324|nr:ABC transporter permease subunit [Candidatus Halocynthiibacter alkanivorans]
MNFEGIIEYSPLFLTGIVTTVLLALSSLALGLLGGILLALAKLSSIWPLRALANVFSDFFRGIPEILVLMVVFFALPVVLADLTGTYVEITPFVAGLLTLSIAFASFASETIRAAFQAISKGELEAAAVYGFSDWQVFYRIKLPLMWRNAVPGLGNIWQTMLKDTALISVIGLSDVMRAAKAGGDAFRDPFSFLLVAALIYLVITLFSEAVQRRLEAHLRQEA